MPVIIVGADAPVGELIVEAVAPAAAEVRAFISDVERADEFKQRGAKVAVGDVSDHSHVEGACLHCFCAILVMDAASDSRERSFAPHARAVFQGWGLAIAAAGVRRAIWVGAPADLEVLPEPDPGNMETARVSTDPARHPHLRSVAGEVARLEGLRRLP